MKPTPIGVIGLGLIWLRVHKPALEKLQNVFNPVALCDVSAERRATAAADFPHARVLESHEELLQLPEIETVLVLTPIALNAPIALAALEAGKDVIMEKPIARSVAEGRRLMETAQRLGRRLYVLEQMAYRRAEADLAALINDGGIGDLVLWERVQHLEGDTAQGAMRYDTTPWRKAADFPLGPLFDGGVHLIAGLTKVFGPPVKVTATGRTLRPEYGDYDQVTMLFEYASGVTGVLSHSAFLPPLQNYFYVHGTHGALSVERESVGVTVTDRPSSGPTVDAATRQVELPQEHAYTAMWQAIADAHQSGKLPYYTPRRALQDVAILEAVDRSIKTGQGVPIEQI